MRGIEVSHHHGEPVGLPVGLVGDVDEVDIEAGIGGVLERPVGEPLLLQPVPLIPAHGRVQREGERDERDRAEHEFGAQDAAPEPRLDGGHRRRRGAVVGAVLLQLGAQGACAGLRGDLLLSEPHLERLQARAGLAEIVPQAKDQIVLLGVGQRLESRLTIGVLHDTSVPSAMWKTRSAARRDGDCG